MLVWGGTCGSAEVCEAEDTLPVGGRYDPALQRWIAMTAAGAPETRAAFTPVWTGSQMIIWGGGGPRNTGGIYTPPY